MMWIGLLPTAKKMYFLKDETKERTSSVVEEGMCTKKGEECNNIIIIIKYVFKGENYINKIAIFQLKNGLSFGFLIGACYREKCLKDAKSIQFMGST